MSKASDALIEVLREINAAVDKPIDMYAIGIPMVMGRRFTEDEVYHALMWLQSEKVIELPGNNTLRLMKPLA